MSTRAIYTFCEAGTDQIFHVYKHHDGYPSGALGTIRDAFAYFAWRLPRYEPDEAAASFVAAGKASELIRFHKGKPDTYRDGTEFPMADWLAYGPAAHLPGGKYHTSRGGGERLLPSGRWSDVAPGDIQYRYVIDKAVGNKPVTVTGYAVSCSWPAQKWSQRKLGTVDVAALLEMDDAAFKALCERWSGESERKLTLVKGAA